MQADTHDSFLLNPNGVESSSNSANASILRLFLVRHGETESNAAGIVAGQTESVSVSWSSIRFIRTRCTNDD